MGEVGSCKRGMNNACIEAGRQHAMLADDERLFILLVAWLVFGDWPVTASIRCGPVIWQILVVLRDPCVETTQWHVKI